MPELSGKLLRPESPVLFNNGPMMLLAPTYTPPPKPPAIPAFIIRLFASASGTFNPVDCSAPLIKIFSCAASVSPYIVTPVATAPPVFIIPSKTFDAVVLSTSNIFCI